jgi:hypothetical protein
MAKKRKTSHKTTKNTQPKLKKNLIDLAKLFPGTPVIDLNDDYVTHYGSEGATTINWMAPTLISKEVLDGKMYLQLLWGAQIVEGKQVHSSNVSLSIIGKSKTGKFVYNTDTPDLTLNTVWEDIDQMLWEYEIPRELKQEIMNLPISDVSEEFYVDYEKSMKYHHEMAMSIFNNNHKK